MEFDEILSYKPELDLEKLEASAAGKRKRPADENVDDGFKAPKVQGGGEDERARAMRLMMEDDEPAQAADVDDRTLARMALALERRVNKNRTMRVKYSTEPSRFMDSELELNDAIKEFGTLATVPSLYPKFVELGTLKTVVGLLHHDNTDIGGSAIELLQELTDGDVFGDVDDADTCSKALLEGLFDAQLLPYLVETLKGTEEPKDSDTVHRCLGIIENMLELQPNLAERIAKEGDILEWLLKRVKGKKYDNNKLYASEILAILVQNSDANREALAKIEGIGFLLKTLSQYKKKDPATAEESEMMENLFDVLTSLLMYPPNRERFVAEEGLDLMIIMLRERKFSQHGALKVLNHTISGVGAAACVTFIDRLGLKSLFPAFMKTPSASKSKKLFSQADYEEHTSSIVSVLLTNLTLGGHEQHALRVLRKFIENDYAKLERLVELHLKYAAKVNSCEQAIQQEIRELEAEGEEIDDILENDHFLKRLDAGLATLQSIDMCIAEVCFQMGTSTRDRIAQLLKLKGGDFSTVGRIVLECKENLALNMEDKSNAARIDRIDKILLML